MNELLPSLEELKEMISTSQLSYHDWGGALPSRAIDVSNIIGKIDNPGLLRELLTHADTLAGEANLDEHRVYPIGTVREAIQRRLSNLNV